MRLAIYRVLERLFQWLSDWAENMRIRYAYCDNCGRNRYTNPPCYGRNDHWDNV